MKLPLLSLALLILVGCAEDVSQKLEGFPILGKCEQLTYLGEGCFCLDEEPDSNVYCPDL